MKAPAGEALRRFSARWYAKRPLSEWPLWLSVLHGIKIPRAVVAHSDVSPSGGSNIKILLALLDRSISLPGDIAEFGVYRGASLLPVGLHLRRQGVAKMIYGFDSFSGFDESISIDHDLGVDASKAHRTRGGMGDTSYDLVLGKIRRFGLKNIDLIEGQFRDAFDNVSDKRFCFAHLDCDLYSAYRDVLEFVYPRLSRGGIVLLDEYNDPSWPGCNKAVDEFLVDRPEELESIVEDNYEKRFFVKQ